MLCEAWNTAIANQMCSWEGARTSEGHRGASEQVPSVAGAQRNDHSAILKGLGAAVVEWG